MSQIAFQKSELALEAIEAFEISAASTPEDAFKILFSVEYLEAAYNAYLRKKPVRGLDGMSIRNFDKVKTAQFAYISEKALSGKYKFAPYLELLKSKGRSKAPRTISIPILRDKLTLFSLNKFLNHLYGDEIKRVHPNEQVSRLCNSLRERTKITRYYRGDIKDFYPSICRKIMKKKLKKKFDYDPF